MEFRHRGDRDERNELPMTSMIDVVFLLLVFFIMTFKISAQEGDFNVKMPKPGEGVASESTDLSLKLRLTADDTGQLSEIVLNDNLSFAKDWGAVRAKIVELVGDEAGPSDEDGPEVEIDLDYNLHYIHVIEAITAVTGYRTGDDVVKLIDRIKFAPRH